MSVRVAVVGAGISGLAAAWQARRAGAEVVVLEADSRAGGKVGGSEVAGIMIDSGPDGFLVRDPAVADMCHQLGLGGELVSPAMSRPYVWTDGALRRLPHEALLGVPYNADAASLGEMLSPEGLAALRSGLESRTPPLGDSGNLDASVGAVLRPRIGDEAFERLVDPLVGGIYAGSADRLSIEACAPALHSAVARGGSLGVALRWVAERQQAEWRGAAAGSRGAGGARWAPAGVFGSLRGGVSRLADALAERLGHRLLLSAPVLALQPERASTGRRRGWRLATPEGAVSADAVILAVPAWIAARLVEPHSPDAAAILGGIEYSDVAVTAFVLPTESVAHPLDGAGFLVPRCEGAITTACTWLSSKWAHYRRPGRVVLRVSAGRTDDRRWFGMDDNELVGALAEELIGFGLIDASAPPGTISGDSAAVRVTRWHRGLPQYRPGHLVRVADVEACLLSDAPGLIVSGSALRGLGLPACVRQGREAAVKATGGAAPVG